MLRRNLASEFVAGAYVFPGGSVDPDDRGPKAEALCRGRTDAEASAILGVDRAAWPSGWPPCGSASRRPGCWWPDRRRRTPADGTVCSTPPTPTWPRASPPTATRSTSGGAGCSTSAGQEGLVLAVDAVHYVSHWITPELAPRRYDTRFFVTAAPPGQVARHDDGETIATIWIRPAEALARYAAGEIELLPPTIANLRKHRGLPRRPAR